MLGNITGKVLEVFVYATGGASVGFAGRAIIDAFQYITG